MQHRYLGVSGVTAGALAAGSISTIPGIPGGTEIAAAEEGDCSV